MPRLRPFNQVVNDNTTPREDRVLTHTYRTFNWRFLQ